MKLRTPKPCHSFLAIYCTLKITLQSETIASGPVCLGFRDNYQGERNPQACPILTTRSSREFKIQVVQLERVVKKGLQFVRFVQVVNVIRFGEIKCSNT